MTSAAAVVGRDRELATIDEFLAADGGPAVLVLEGDAGIGKTTLWREGVSRAATRGFRILAGEAAASEVELGFSVLADLLAESAPDLRVALPPAQWRALEVAVLLAEPGPDPAQPRAIGVAFLAALRLLARQRPLLVAVDDVQWVDPSSRAMLEFAARRLTSERVGLLLARRLEGDGVAPFALDRALPHERLTRLSLGPLSLGALNELLHSHLDVTFPRRTLRKLAEASGGNPFFALELARAAARHGGRFDGDELLPLPGTLRVLVADRLEALPPAAREALLMVALASDPSVALVARTLPGDAWQRVRPAVDAGILELDGERIRFAHPLLASVAQATADLGQRRDTHRLIADAVSDQEERALHLSLAATGPSATLASAIERASKHAHNRGATDAAAVLAERAVWLTPPDRPNDARRRTLKAAESHFDAGSIGQAETLLERVVEVFDRDPASQEVDVPRTETDELSPTQPSLYLCQHEREVPVRDAGQQVVELLRREDAGLVCDDLGELRVATGVVGDDAVADRPLEHAVKHHVVLHDAPR